MPRKRKSDNTPSILGNPQAIEDALHEKPKVQRLIAPDSATGKLKALFERLRKAGIPSSRVSEEMGVSRNAVSQYTNGIIALSTPVTNRLSESKILQEFTGKTQAELEAMFYFWLMSDKYGKDVAIQAFRWVEE